jgi:hypothetical protein
VNRTAGGASSGGWWTSRTSTGGRRGNVGCTRRRGRGRGRSGARLGGTLASSNEVRERADRDVSGSGSASISTLIVRHIKKQWLQAEVALWLMAGQLEGKREKGKGKLNLGLCQVVRARSSTL